MKIFHLLTLSPHNVKQKSTKLLLRSTDIAAESTEVVWKITEVGNKGAEVILGCKST